MGPFDILCKLSSEGGGRSMKGQFYMTVRTGDIVEWVFIWPDRIGKADIELHCFWNKKGHI